MSPRNLHLLLFSALAALTGCQGFLGTQDYAKDKEGLVSEIGNEFYTNKKTIYMVEHGKKEEKMWFTIDQGVFQVLTNIGTGPSAALGEIDNKPERCMGITGYAPRTNVTSVFSICTSVEPLRLGVDNRGDVARAGTPYVLIYTNLGGKVSASRARFLVIEEGTTTSSQIPSATTSATPKQISACEAVEEGLSTAEAECKSGRIASCRDVSGWVAKRVMEGCTHNPGPSQDPQGYSGQTSPDEFQPQPLPTMPELSSDQEPVAVQEAAVELKSKNTNPPRYPPAAYRAGVQGEVVLVIEVAGNGAVSAVTVDSSSGNRDLDHAAVEASRKWTYSAAKAANGQTIPSRIRVPVTFSLSSTEDPKQVSSRGISASSGGFGSIRDAIVELWAHTDYANLQESDFYRIDATRGLAEIDASTQMFLPPGSRDTIVVYTENNRGTPFLRVDRFDGRQWRDVSASALPGYTNANGSNFYLDTAEGVVKVRSSQSQVALQYKAGRFVEDR